MILSIVLALFLPCVGMSLVFVVYMCLLWYAASQVPEDPEKSTVKKGLSSTQLEKLPKVTGNQLVHGNECAICLDEIEDDEPARLVPGCNHGFHVECADTWFSKSLGCPICRTQLDPQFLENSQNPC